MATIQLVTFDLDNTLWDVDSVIRRAETMMRTWLRTHIPDFDARFPPAVMMELRAQVVAAQPALRHDLSRMREALLFAAISQCGFSPPAARQLAADAFKVFYEARHDVVFFPGALAALDALAGRYRLAALTNGNADFTRLALDRYFSFGFSAADVGAAKPAPDMFHAALAAAGLDPAAGIHVGDHPVDDIQGAAGVGMHTIWVNLTDQVLPAGAPTPTRTVRDLSDIPDSVVSIDAG